MNTEKEVYRYNAGTRFGLSVLALGEAALGVGLARYMGVGAQEALGTVTDLSHLPAVIVGITGITVGFLTADSAFEHVPHNTPDQNVAQPLEN